MMRTVVSAPEVARQQYASGSRIPHVAVVVPVRERPAALDAIYREYAAPLRAGGTPYEFIFVVEPWAVERVTPLQPLREAAHPIRVLELGQEAGESSMLAAAVAHTRAPIILTLPAYRRVRPQVLPELISSVESGVEVATAARDRRDESWINRLQGRLFHFLVSNSVGGTFRDMGCGVRAVRREVLTSLPLYGDTSRFLPLLASNEGFIVAEVSAAQHPDDRRTRIYGPGVYLRRLIDIFGFAFLLRFTQKPLRFFGLIGTAATLMGGMVLGVMLIQRLGGQPLADRPLLLVGVLLVMLGIQIIALGLIGEIIVHFAAIQRPRYRVRSDTGAGRPSGDWEEPAAP